MLDKLLDLFLQFIDDLLPWQVIPYYDRGVRLRLGKPKGVLNFGFHWKIPFADQILTHMVKPTTLNLDEQSVTTKDGMGVVLKTAIKYEIENVEKLLLETNSATDALSDMVQGIIRNKIINKNWSECNDATFTNEILKASKVEAKKWGISILEVTLTDLGLMRSIRILNRNK